MPCVTRSRSVVSSYVVCRTSACFQAAHAGASPIASRTARMVSGLQARSTARYKGAVRATIHAAANAQ